MTPRTHAAVFLLAGLVLLRPAVAHGHHEAIFGAQSSLILSADRYVSVQVFDRHLGTSGGPARETTTVVSAGVRLSRRYPLTFAAILPYSRISAPGRARISGAEDIVLGLRYRHDLEGLQQRWKREGNFLIGMGAFELNNGTIDHTRWSGPLDSMAALLGSLERGAWSAIGFSVVRCNLEDATGDKDGDTVFTGGGLAYTPGEDFQTGRLISYQAGWSFEHYARDRAAGRLDPNSGGDELLLHPTVVYSPGHGLLWFGMASLPVWRSFQDPTAEDRYRFGTGVVYGW
jgi:hypothetical protein